MKKPLGRDAREFVDGVVGYLRKGKTGDAAAPRIESLLRNVTARAAGEGIAHVSSPVPLTVVEKQNIKKSLEKVLGRTLRLEYMTNTALIAGLRIVIGDLIVDTTWDYQLKVMERHIV